MKGWLTLLLFVGGINFVFSQENIVSINPADAKYTINKNIYGHFAEHLGNCIYNGFYVGDTNKIIPNTEGVRNEIVDALKKLKVANLRWPGGCFADTHHWKDGVLPVKIISNDYVFGGEKLPAVSVSASKDKAGVTHISLVNIDAAKSQDISININGVKYTSVSGRIITSKKLQDYNSFEEPNKIHPEDFKDAKLSVNSLQVKLPPFSVVVLTLK